jgi:biopolymer transport protein ExbB
LVVLDAMRFDYSQGRADGTDLRFAIGSQELAYEIDTWQMGGTSLVWVKVPTIAVGSGAAMHMFYGNPSAPSGEDPTAVWSNGFAAVWHLRGDLLDSSANGNDASDVGGSTEAPAQLGSGRLFNGVNNYLTVAPAPSINDLTTFTYSAWIHPTAGGDREIISKAASNRELRLRENVPNTILRGCINYSSTNACSDAMSGAITVSDWHNVAMSFDAASDTTIHLFLGGTEINYAVQDMGSGTRQDDAASPLNIGRRTSNNRYFQGTIDEVRVSSVIRNDDWISASYRGSLDQLISYGAEESACD